MNRESELVKIIKRLQSMTLDSTNEIQERNFDLFGVNVLTVLYDQPSKTFAVYGGRDDRRFAFDDLDALAIDIYENLAEFRAVF